MSERVLAASGLGTEQERHEQVEHIIEAVAADLQKAAEVANSFQAVSWAVRESVNELVPGVLLTTESDAWRLIKEGAAHFEQRVEGSASDSNLSRRGKGTEFSKDENSASNSPETAGQEMTQFERWRRLRRKVKDLWTCFRTVRMIYGHQVVRNYGWIPSVDPDALESPRGLGFFKRLRASAQSANASHLKLCGCKDTAWHVARRRLNRIIYERLMKEKSGWKGGRSQVSKHGSADCPITSKDLNLLKEWDSEESGRSQEDDSDLDHAGIEGVGGALDQNGILIIQSREKATHNNTTRSTTSTHPSKPGPSEPAKEVEDGDGPLVDENDAEGADLPRYPFRKRKPPEPQNDEAGELGGKKEQDPSKKRKRRRRQEKDDIKVTQREGSSESSDDEEEEDDEVQKGSSAKRSEVRRGDPKGSTTTRQNEPVTKTWRSKCSVPSIGLFKEDFEQFRYELLEAYRILDERTNLSRSGAGNAHDEVSHKVGQSGSRTNPHPH